MRMRSITKPSQVEPPRGKGVPPHQALHGPEHHIPTDVPSPGTGLFPPAPRVAASSVLRLRGFLCLKQLSFPMGMGGFLSWLSFWKGCMQARQQPGSPGCASQLPRDLDRAGKTF